MSYYISKHTLYFKSKNENEYILLNSLSGAIDIVDKEVINVLKSIENNIILNKKGESIVEVLLRREYIFLQKEYEDKRLRELYKKWQSAMVSKSEHFFIYPTYRCNLKCTYCFQDKSLRKSKVMDDDVIDKMFETIEIIHKERNGEVPPSITLFGGEPLINVTRQFKAISQILECCTKNRYKVSIITNGVDIVHYLDLLSNHPIEYVQVTLDGTRDVHNQRRIFANGKGSFDQIVDGIDEALNQNMKIALRVNIDSQNIDNLPMLANFIFEKGWDKKKFRCYIGAVRDSNCIGQRYIIPEHEIIKRVLELYTKYEQTRIVSLLENRWIGNIVHLIKHHKLHPPQISYCGANVGRYSLDLYGDVYTCAGTAGIKKWSIGKFYPNFQIDTKHLNMWRNRNIFTLPKCKHCKMALLCGGGCTFLALSKGGSFNSTTVCPNIEDVLQLGFNYYLPELKKMVQSIKG